MENTINLNDFKEVIFTQEDRMQLSQLKDRPIVFDEDCPETTPEMAIRFHRINPVRKTVLS